MSILQYGTEPLADEKPYEGAVMGAPLADMETDAATDEEKMDDNKEKAPPYVRSGMVRNQQSIIGHGAIINAPVGKGRVVFFTFNPLNRFLNHHDSGLLWNVLINWNALD